MASQRMFGGLSTLLVCLMVVSGVQAQTYPTYSGITYATYSTDEGAKVCKLDVYIPTVGEPPYPVLIYVHGGGWSDGTRTETGYVPIEVLDYGIATVAIDYRLTSQAHEFGTANGSYVPVTWPAQIHDCKAAVRWVRGNASTYDFDADHICAFGFSAGGHLVAAMGALGGITSYTRGSQTIDMEGTVGDYDSYSSEVQAVCDYSGPTDILYLAPDVTTPPGCVYDFDADDSPSSHLVGSTAYSLGVGDIRTNINSSTSPYPFLAATTISANPITFVSLGLPPMYIVHGTADNVVPINQAVRLNNALLASGNSSKYIAVQNAGHGGYGDTVVSDTVDWIVGVLKGDLVCPSITTQPQGQTVAPGDTATFSVMATGTATLSYQWQKNSTNVSNGGHYSGCTTATLTVSSADTNDATNYRCMVTNSGGTVISSAATLTINTSTAPSIAQQPSNQSVLPSGTAAFVITATGSSPLSYQWQKDNSNLSNGGHYSGCTTTSLTVSSADSNDEADYRCVVTNTYGSDTSNAASLTITNCADPTFANGSFEASTAASPPSAWTTYIQTSKSGNWTIQAATPPEGTQWQQTQVYNTGSYGGIRQNATGLTSGYVYTISGSYKTNSTSATASVRYNLSGNTDRANSTALVSKTDTSWSTFSGSVTATGETLTLFLDHLNGTSTNKASGFDNIKVAVTDCLAEAPTITQHPAAQNVCPGTNASFSVTATGEGTLGYQWQKNSSNISNGGHYSGCTTATLAVTGADTNDAANYRCIVSNEGGDTTSNAAALTLKTATSITGHPSNQTIAAGGTASFSVSATGDGTLSYQWQKNSANMSNGGHYSGVTTATMTVTSASTDDAANYRCIVTAGCGSATSNAATLTVTTCSQATLINGDFEASTVGNPPSSWTTYIQSAKSGNWTIQTVTPPAGTQWQQTQVYNTGSYGGIRQNVTGLTSGFVYTISGSYKTNSTSATASVRYNLSGNTDRANSTVLVSKYATSWGTFSANVTATGSSLMLFLDHLNGTSSNKASGFDNIEVQCAP